MQNLSVSECSLNELSEICHGIAVEKGFWDEERNIGEALMLIVTELAEAMEDINRGIEECSAETPNPTKASILHEREQAKAKKEKEQKAKKKTPASESEDASSV